MTIVVTGAGLVLPGNGGAADLLAPPAGPDPLAPVDPAALVGRKGLRYKDRATQLAYCAVALALRDAG